MRRIRLGESGREEVIIEVVEVLKRGGLVIYPTDTVYGLGADAENEESVRRVYEVKGRPGEKRLTIAVSDIDMLERYALLDEISRELILRFLPGKVTFILRKTSRVLDLVNPEAIGVRIPNLPIVLEIIRCFGRAITATSANISGRPPKLDPDEAASEVKADLLLDYGVLPPSKPSTVVDLTGGEPVLIREGDVPFEAILREYRRITSSRLG
ncbi:MAG: threonylcarbamoyl-AMP synthase [Candidatus Korarchaeota archaeon NZ13-K]|nr:MAG: threonylcarbamoyl-AMP synthase [Candidatus Korarchaeota archaeon NZ13-K]